ncbi:MAG: class I SAM-dependent methyltransferase [Planctomycetota bacterium]|nr:MAG: class I SAM-dependent methyltransferase [Planctomycetota bacterium]
MDITAIQQIWKVQHSYWWYKVRRQVILQLIRPYLQPLPSVKWLDAGCGPGANLSAFQTFGEVYGVDIHPQCLEYAKKTIPQARLVQADISKELPFEKNFFDIITLLDVLEHIQEDQQAIQNLLATLKPNGYLVLTTPAYPWLWSAFDELVHHQRRYTIPTLQQLLNKPKCTIRKLSHFYFSVFPLTILLRKCFTPQKLTIKNKEKIQITPSVPNWLNQWLYLLCAWEALYLKWGNLPWGSSLIAIAQKNQN